MRILTTVLILILAITACRDAEEEATPPGPAAVDSVETERVDTVITSETQQIFDNSGFTGFAKSRSGNFDWSKFRLVNVWKEDSAIVSPYTPDDQFYRLYGPFLKYSPDSTKYLDLDSYNIDISHDEQGRKIGQAQGPDTEVSLIDLETKQRTRLVFVGPSSSVEDGGWIDSETLVLVGIQENPQPGSKTAVVWKYHVPTETFYLYELPDPLTAEKIMHNWRRERLKGVNVR